MSGIVFKCVAAVLPVGRLRAVALTVCFVVLTAGVLLGAAPAGAAGIVATEPITNAIGVDLGANVVVTYNAAIKPASVTTATFVAHGMMSGRRDGGFTTGSGDTRITFDPESAYFAGEVMRVSATGGISDTGNLPVTPYQWQFTTGPVLDRCGGEFVDIGAAISGTVYSGVAWADYDGDGDLDFVLNGRTEGAVYVGTVYRNDGGGAFTDIDAGLDGTIYGSVAWGDYDNDGDPDILLTGWNQGGARVAKVYRNDDGTFVDIDAALTPVYWSSAAWGDYDNDGDLDILLSGDVDGSTSISRIFRNDGSDSFNVETNAALTGVYDASVAWGDYDNDGDLDALIAGKADSGVVSKVYRNDGGGFFTEISAGLTGVYLGSATWADYDNDGYLDILLSGVTAYWYGTYLYHNEAGSGTFAYVKAGLPGLSHSWTAWGDFDNDGDLDLLLAGDGTSGDIADIYRNDGAGVFTYTGVSLPGISDSAVAWGDYDNDGALDILLPVSDRTRVYRNAGCGEPAVVTQVTPTSAVTNGAVVTYSLVLNNTGVTATNVQISDRLPTQVTFKGWLGDDHGAALVGNSITWSGTVTANEPITWTWTATFTGECGDVVNATGWYRYLGATTAYTATFRAADQCLHTESTAPLPNAVGVALDGSIAATCDAPIASGSVSDQSFVAHGMMGGRLGGSHNTTGNIVTFDPDRDLFTGETVRTSLTGNLESTTGDRLVPFQWQFTTGPVISRCVGGFTAIDAGLPGVSYSAAAWGDYDGDGDLDVVLTGDTASGSVAGVFRNDGDGTFTDIAAGLTGMSDGSVAWGDYDNDGDLDILIAGYWTGGVDTFLYRNDGGGVFTAVAAGLPGIYIGTVAWGDYDNDGYLDVLLAGHTMASSITGVYRNDGAGNFTDIAAGLPAVISASAAWGDFDNDGDLDIALSGEGDVALVTAIYRNDGGGTFTDIGAGLSPVESSALAWGDYDNDGNLDLVVIGYDSESSAVLAKIYRNNGDATFTDIGAGLTGVAVGTAAWGDYDNDGDLDLVLTGADSSYNKKATIYRNNDGAFVDIDAGLPGVLSGAATWGDYDNDGDLDLLITGEADSGAITQIYDNGDCAALHIAKSVSPQAGVHTGDLLTYTVVLSNTGDAAGAVLMTDTLPNTVDFASWLGDDHGATQTGREIAWTGTVSEGASLAWTWQVTFTGDLGRVINTAWYSHTVAGRDRASAAFSAGTIIFYFPIMGKNYAFTP